MKRLLTTSVFWTIFVAASGQTTIDFADSIRKKYEIPELAFAVVSADTILVLKTLGVQRMHRELTAKPNDRFHIGSNTKAITSFVAALLVEQGLLHWNTKFFTLFPELKRNSKKAYRSLTLQDLLTFRGKLPPYTYTFDKPTRKQITGGNHAQRIQLAQYFLAQKPMKIESGLTPSNADYVLAGLMLERATGKPFKQLVSEFGKTQGIRFGFDYPNLADTLQPWGHDHHLNPLPPFDNYKLNWLLSAGNINVDLAGYTKFIQLQLKGLNGQTKILSAQTFEKLLFGLPTFSFGWFNKLDATTYHHIAYNEGNAGAFITRVEIIRETGKAFIVFTNSSTDETTEGITILMSELQTTYGR